MRFFPLTSAQIDSEELKIKYKESREIGIIHISDDVLFFRKGFKIYYIPYSDINRCFRRVMLVPAKLCCGKGNLSVENLVICCEDKELAQIELPGTRAAKLLMEELRERIPNADFTAPRQEGQA